MDDSYKIAVAMSVYKSDVKNYVVESVNSILSQTYKNFHLYIEVDGGVDSDVERFLCSLSNQSNVSVSFNDKNKGLAYRLNCIIDKSLQQGGFDYLARMDADDISEPNRFELQVKFLTENPNVYIVGSDVVEIDNQGNSIFYKRMIPDNKTLVNKVIKRCPFNHPTVMFRMDVFSRYNLRYKPELMNTQDYYLWVDVIYNKLSLANINSPLLKFRIDQSFHRRRGLKKSLNECKSRFYAMNKLSIMTPSNVVHTILLFMLRLSPEYIKRVAYKYMR